MCLKTECVNQHETSTPHDIMLSTLRFAPTAPALASTKRASSDRCRLVTRVGGPSACTRKYALLPLRTPQRVPTTCVLAVPFDVDSVTSSLFTFNMWVIKCGLLFTMFYSTLNWWFYKRMREDIEKDNEDREEAKKQKGKKHNKN